MPEQIQSIKHASVPQAGPAVASRISPATCDARGYPPRGCAVQNSNPIFDSRTRPTPKGTNLPGTVAGVTEPERTRYLLGYGAGLREDVPPFAGAESLPDPLLGAGTLQVCERSCAQIGQGRELGHEVVDDGLAGELGLLT